MGQCSNRGADDRNEITPNAVSIEKAKSLSSNAAVTSARYRSTRKVLDDYEVDGKVLGSGLCGDVVLVRGKVDKRRYALKTIRKQHVPAAKLQQLSAEVEIYLMLDHPNIARLHNVYEKEEEICLVTECCEGGELYFRLQKRGVYTDAAAANAARQMLRAVGYLHANNVVHRDLKLENFLYESEESTSQLKLIDFGFAKIWDSSTLMMASCGSIAYVSPDVLNGKGYTNKCDLWSLGVIVWMLLTGYPPFHGDEKVMMSKIKAGQADWSHKSRWKPVSEDAVDFLKCLLNKDPSKRPRAQEALKHKWLTNCAQEGVPVSLGRTALRSIERYASASKIRRAVLQLLAQELAPDETKELREAFLAIDRSGEGTICLRDLKEAIRCGQGSSSPRKRRVIEEKETNRQTSAAEVGRKNHAYIGDVSNIPTPCLSTNAHSPFGSGISDRDGAGSPITPGRSLRRANSGAIEELFSKMDSNNDERIYYSDFLAATMAARGQRQREEAIKAAFSRLDDDGSGTISVADFKSVIGETFEKVHVEELVAEVDPSCRGEITYEAFLKVIEDNDSIAPLTPKSVLNASSPLRRNLGFFPEASGGC